jgi:ubiquinone biosynthesis protein
VDYLLALVENDPEKVAKTALDMSIDVPPDLDFQRFTTDVMYILECIHGARDDEVNLGRFLLDLTSLCRSYGVFLRSDYILMARALISTEAAGRAIDPSFDALAVLAPIASEYIARRKTLVFSDRPLFKDIARNFKTFAELPNRFERLLGKAERGEFVIQLESRDHGAQMNSLKQAAYIISIGLITASLVVGSSLIYTSDIGPHAYGFPLFGLVGFSLSGLFAAWVILKLLRM